MDLMNLVMIKFYKIDEVDVKSDMFQQQNLGRLQVVCERGEFEN